MIAPTLPRMGLARAFLGPLRQHPGRALLSIAALALGVALGVAVAAVNRSALDEFGRGLRTLSAQADIELRGPRSGFDESVYPALMREPDVALASPMLEFDAKPAGRNDVLKLIGLDPFRAAALAPALVPPRDIGESAGAADLLDEDVIFLSPAAARALGKRVGDALSLRSGSRDIAFRVAGLLPGVSGGQQLGVMDIATAQWRFARLGRVSRIDLRLVEGANLEAAMKRIAAHLPAGVFAQTPQQSEGRADRLSRAYRVNLGMLALIALVTGAFLVFSAQALSVLRRRSQLAYLRAAGITRGELLAWLLGEGALLGALGSALGLAAGYAVAWFALRTLGGDLGAGFFAGSAPQLVIDFRSAAGFALLGVAAAVAGSALPALEAARAVPAQALKAGDVPQALQRRARGRLALACLATGALCALLPPLYGLPVFGYLAIALLLVGGVLSLPMIAAGVLAHLPSPRGTTSLLAFQQLRGAPHLNLIGASGILAAVALASAMAIMVGSFRHSVDAWLEQVLPADLYLRAARSGETAYFDIAEQRALVTTPGIARSGLLRLDTLLLDPALPPVALIARSMDPADPGATLPLLRQYPVVPGVHAAYISEAVADLYGWRLGQSIELPLAGREVRFVVAGVWRDYARQHGAIAIDLDTYRELTQDQRVSDISLWLAPGVDAPRVTASLRAGPLGDALEIAEPGAIRALSLRIFDRTFAVTYALEAVAIVIGIAGVGASFAALATSRRREFGMLRHLGLTRTDIARMLAAEGGLVSAIGVGAGLLLGGAISVVLIEVVNRQSFHWSMDLHVPWLTLAGFAAAMIALATASAVLAARSAMQVDAVRAVREDW